MVILYVIPIYSYTLCNGFNNHNSSHNRKYSDVFLDNIVGFCYTLLTYDLDIYNKLNYK